MAKALQCPSCGTKKRIDTLAGSDTFTCEGCGQVTKVPPGLQDDHRGSGSAKRSKPAPVVATASSPGGSPPAPPKRRSGSGAAVDAAAATGSTAAGSTAAGSGGTAAIPVPPLNEGRGGVAVAAPPVRGSGSRRGAAIRDGQPRPVKAYWRVLAWLVALPIALAVVGIPARGAGYLNSQRLLDVIVEKSITRFVPIFVIVVLWALVTAVLVTASVATGQRVATWRRARRSR